MTDYIFRIKNIETLIKATSESEAFELAKIEFITMIHAEKEPRKYRIELRLKK